MRLVGNKDLSAPDFYAQCCLLFAAYSALLFCDASCQTPRKAAHGTRSGGDPQALFVAPLMPPTPRFQMWPFQPTGWKASISVSGWVWARASHASLQRGPSHAATGVPRCAPHSPPPGAGLREIRRTSHWGLGGAHGVPCALQRLRSPGWFFLPCDLNCPLVRSL